MCHRAFSKIECTMSESELDRYKKWVFGCTFVNYAMSHWTRKSYTNVKEQMMTAGVSAYILAAMDSGFMFTYAGGSFITGALGDRFSPTKVIAIGLLGSSVVLFLIVLGASSPMIAESASVGLIWFAGVQIIHGFFQATGGPVNTAIMNNWFPKEGRGAIFGLWTMHQYVGDIVAAFAGAWILSSPLNWRMAIVIPLVINGIWSIINFVAVPATPEEVGLKKDQKLPLSAQEAKSLAAEPPSEDRPITYAEAFGAPNVMNYAIAFGFFKLINYAMFFQLPVILASNFDSATANLISSLYSFGMMPGGYICGKVSDIYGGRRACVCATMMAILVPLLIFFAYFMDSLDVVFLLVMLCIMGTLVGGPNNIITSAVAADIADAFGSKAAGTITGIINGSGSVTAAGGQLLIPIFSAWGEADGVGYRYVWLFLVFCTVVGTLCLYPKIKKELAPTVVASGGAYQAVATRAPTRGSTIM